MNIGPHKAFFSYQNVFMFVVILHKNLCFICCVYQLEVPQQGTSPNVFMFVLYPHKNTCFICCGYSLDVPQQGTLPNVSMFVLFLHKNVLLLLWLPIRSASISGAMRYLMSFT